MVCRLRGGRYRRNVDLQLEHLRAKRALNGELFDDPAGFAVQIHSGFDRTAGSGGQGPWLLGHHGFGATATADKVGDQD